MKTRASACCQWMRTRSSIEIEYLDGDIEEIDLETWQELDLDKIDQPEGWSGRR